MNCCGCGANPAPPILLITHSLDEAAMLATASA
jgi:ABC-type nitrate/sulfonate/bicarbonate transport system ATPase subunit